MGERLETGSRSIAPANSGETYELPRVCAMFDKPYLARYVRGAGGLFRLAETVKLEKTTVAGAEKESDAPKAVTLTNAEISKDSPQERCPWCGVKGALVLCGDCAAWVCRGKTAKRAGEDYFQCRASCGGKGTVIDTDEGFEGAKREATPIEKRVPLPKPEKGPALPGADRRLKS